MINEYHVLTADNIFTKEECENLINLYTNNNSYQGIHTNPNGSVGYYYNDIDINSFPYSHVINNFLNLYTEKYPEINMTSSYWALSTLRFKYFKKGNSFDNFHSEHSITHSQRVIGIQIYLTEHDCGTEFFYLKKTIKSKVGRVCIFPAYFTHTHKGQPDFLKDRMIITGYYNFVERGKHDHSNELSSEHDKKSMSNNGE